METPWGAAQTTRRIAEGITEVSTAGHGGIMLSPERWRAMPEALRRYEPFAGTLAYEEDVDWAFVALAFPQSFSAYEVRCAWRTLRQSETLREVLAALKETDGAHFDYLERVVSGWEREHAARWLPGSSGSSGDGWAVSFRRVGDGRQVWRILADDEWRNLHERYHEGGKFGPLLNELPGRDPIRIGDTCSCVETGWVGVVVGYRNDQLELHGRDAFTGDLCADDARWFSPADLILLDRAGDAPEGIGALFGGIGR